LAELAGSLGGLEEQRIRTEETAEMAQFERENGIRSPELARVAAAGIAEVDPGARFAELFEQRYKPELDTMEAQRQTAQQQQQFQSSVAVLDRLGI